MAEKNLGIRETFSKENLMMALNAIKQLFKGGSPVTPPKKLKLKKIKGALR